jgi:hypothetical protein
LEFRYLGGPCPGTSTQAGFVCNGDVDLDTVWITVTTVLPISNRTSTLLDQPVNRGDFISLRGPDTEISITISDVVNGEKGTPQQDMVIQTTCVPENGLTLKSTFGSLELVEFVDETFQNSAYAQVEIIYAVSTVTAVEAVVTSATSFGAFAGEQTLLTTPSDPIGPRNKIQLGGEEALIDLTVNRGNMYEFTLNVDGFTVVNPTSTCPTVGSFQFTIR